MKFLVLPGSIGEDKLLSYIFSDYSFDMEPAVKEIGFYILINNLDLIVDENNKVVQLSGFCPCNNWIEMSSLVPKYERGILRVVTELQLGFSFRLNNKHPWPVYINKKEGWICIGDPEKNGEAAEFLNNCVAVINNGELVSVWLKPKFLGSYSEISSKSEDKK